MIGPPALNEYAVDPVGVLTIKPSAYNAVRGMFSMNIYNFKEDEPGIE